MSALNQEMDNMNDNVEDDRFTDQEGDEDFDISTEDDDDSSTDDEAAPDPSSSSFNTTISTASAPLAPVVPNINLSALTTNTLRPINDLTRHAVTPGDLQYNEYVTYLTSIGHVAGATGAAVPRNSHLQHITGDRQDDFTDFRADQAFWSMQNLPNILYELTRPANWLARTDLADPPRKQYQIYSQYLRDLPILPDHISSNVEGWRFEAWVRMDPRVGHANIVARIRPADRPGHKSTIQMRVNRFREIFPALGWVSPGKNFRRDQLALNTRVAAAGIAVANNTTRGVSWGLIDPPQGEAGGRIAVPDAQSQASTVDQSAINGTPLASVVSGASVPASVSASAPAPAPVLAPAQAGPSTLLFRRLPLPPQYVVAAPAAPASAQAPVTVTYQGRVLTLRTQAERAGMSAQTAAMMRTFYPAASEQRDRQLEYILCPIRAPQGFIDNHGFTESFPSDPEASSTDIDVIYVAGPLARLG